MSARWMPSPASQQSRSNARNSSPNVTRRRSCGRRPISPRPLLASLSHDLRTPLTAIRVAVENLRQQNLHADTRRDQAQVALSELNRLTRLFQDILDMARIDASAIRMDRQWITPADIVDAATAHVRHELEGRTLRVDADAESEVQIDPKLTAAALAHLLENAVRYAPADRPITVAARAEGEGLRVWVQDQGPGLEPGELDHLFERFYRGRVARQSSFGTGMGLAITRGLLAAAGGRVWAENASGGGARFTIDVPGANPRRCGRGITRCLREFWLSTTSRTFSPRWRRCCARAATR
jgi:two-component system sensor histidine kinase KdpD